MGNGSPRLRTRLGACALPLVAAGLIGAPAALAEGGLGLPGTAAVTAATDLAHVTAPAAAPEAAAPAEAVLATVASAAATAPAAPVAAAPALREIAPAAAPLAAIVREAVPAGLSQQHAAHQLSTLPAAPAAARPAHAAPRAAAPVRHHRQARTAVAPRRAPQAGPLPSFRGAAATVASHVRDDAVAPAPVAQSELPAPARPAEDGLLSGGVAPGAAAAFFFLLTALGGLFLVRPGLGGRIADGVRGLRPALLYLELERPD
jgi:hypothetical protein